MRIFVLEDNENRIQLFRDFFTKYGIIAHYATSVRNAERMYQRANPDLLFLDHDLGGQVYVDSDEPNTGYQFVKWLKENDPLWRARSYVIHSMNPVGVDNMIEELGDETKNLWRIPFDIKRFTEVLNIAL